MRKPDEKKRHVRSGGRSRLTATRGQEAEVVRDNGPTREEVAERAYFIWMDKGRPADQDLFCWCEAEAELRARRPETARK